MLSWLGFGKKEEQPGTEENNKQHSPVAEHEQVAIEETIEPVLEAVIEQVKESVAEQVTEPVIEQVTEVVTAQVITPAVVHNIAASAEDDESKAEVTVTEESVSIDPVAEAIVPIIATSAVATEVLPEAKLLADLETFEQADELALENSAPIAVDTEINPVENVAEVDEGNAESKLGFFARLKQSLSKTRQNLGGGLVDLFRGKQIDDDLFEELETHLLMADVGVETTMKIIDSLTQSASRKQLKDASALYDLLKIELKKIIEKAEQPLVIPESDGPFVMLMVGVNGVGKTTTIGKLAKQFQAQGKSVILAAGDTFRAAAVEQLQVWGERNDIPVIAQHTGADSASVIFDAISAAKARKVDVIIADTAGRLQNKAHLMEELKKVVRVMKKLDVNAPHEVMLTLDAGTGQNALSQTKLFDEAVGLTGLTLSKLDGTAKGGVVFAIADKHNIPIRYLGVGEGIDDLRPFNGDDFIEAIFSK